ncbi:MAG: ATP-binding protein [Hydrogenophaga sp.]|nr:ATP-binding protein [Hydrogenophaga sp.]
MLRVALLGGESSGKTTLARQLSASLNSAGVRCEVVAEHLRLWSELAGRAPQADEQAAIAAEQTRQIEQSSAEVVIADTSAMVVAAYSEHYFADRSLWPQAVAAQRRIDLTLLMGLDIPWHHDGFFRDSPAVREAVDSLLRRELGQAGIAFQTVYGDQGVRLKAALAAIGGALGRPLVSDDPRLRAGQGRWQCEACSDPDCEHRLFRDLLARRSN